MYKLIIWTPSIQWTIDRISKYLFFTTEARRTNTTYGEPNSTFCFDIPEDQQCRVIITWDQKCMCPVDFITRVKRMGINYNCSKCDSSEIRPDVTENSQVCFTDESSSLNKMLIQYLCTRPPPCECKTDIIINTLLSSYRWSI